MTGCVPTPRYLQPWVIKREEFYLLEEVARNHRLEAKIVEGRPGACFVIGSAETRLEEGMVGVHVIGYIKIEPAERIDIATEFYNDPRREAEVRGSLAKEKDLA